MNKFDTYNRLVSGPVEKFEDLKGRILCKVVNINDEELHFHLTEDHYLKMFHRQDCCESVEIEDIVGDLDDLVNTPILLAEEVTNYDEEPKGSYESYTWTYYKLRTLKGSVDIRWYGSSNGYYSEGVNIEVIGNPTV